MPTSASDREPSLLWSPVVAAAVTLVPGLVGLATGQLLLFPSLGPTAVMQAHAPRHRSSRFYNVVVSHLVGLGAADLSVAIFGLASAPSVFALHALPPARVWATVLAILIGTTVELLLRASHPPAASTTLLAALGSFKPTWRDTAWVVVGVFIVAVVGEAVRRLRLRYSLGT